jgi:hypothetical protein
MKPKVLTNEACSSPNSKPSFNLSNASSERGKAVWTTVSLAADVELALSTSSLPFALALFESSFEAMRPRLLFFFKQHLIKNQELLFFSSTAISVQNIMSMSDATPTNAVEDTPAIPVTANDYDFSYIFNEPGYRINYGFSPSFRLEAPFPRTGLTLLRDHWTHPTATKLVVQVDVRTYDRWTYEWDVKFSAQNPFKAFNRHGDFSSPEGRRAEVILHAFCEAINSIIDFTNDSQNQKPPISTFYVRVPRFMNSRYALRRLLCDVQEGKNCPVYSDQWVQDMYIKLSKTLVHMRKLRAEGVNILLWQNFMHINS